MATKAEIDKLFTEIRELRAERQMLRALAEEELQRKRLKAQERHRIADLKHAQEQALLKWLKAQENLGALPRFVTSQHLLSRYAVFNKFETQVTANRLGRLITAHLSWKRLQARHFKTKGVQRVYDTRPQSTQFSAAGVDAQYNKDFPSAPW